MGLERTGELQLLASPDAPLTVLVVDDEPGLVAAMEELLAQLGCRVETAGATARALELMGQRDYDVLLLDLNLSGGSSRPFWEAVARERPELLSRAILMSGEPVIAPFRGPDGTPVPVLRKPFSPQHLVGTIRNLLARPGAASGPLARGGESPPAESAC